jgi:opacity protein-like surface antigen
MKITIITIFSCFTFAASAQQGMKFTPMITHSIGGSFQKFDGLNSRIANVPQYKQLKDYAATLGLGWMKERNRVISNAGVNIGSSMSGDHHKNSSTIRYFGVNADIGYDLLKSDKLMLYPLAGIGFQQYQAIFYRDNSNVDFDDVLESPAVQNNISSVRFNNSFAVYRFGVGFSLQSPRHPSCSVGLQAGYTGSFKTNGWRTKESQLLANAPQDKVSQFFVGIVFTSRPMFMK